MNVIRIMLLCNILVDCFVVCATSVLFGIPEVVDSGNSGTLIAQMGQVVHFGHVLFCVM